MDLKTVLDSNKHEYINPTLDRKVDQKVLELVADFTITRIPKIGAERVLELGVGDQVWTPKLVDKFADVTTIDGSQDLLYAMRKQLADKRWTPVCSLFEEYKPTQRFDVVLITYVLEHVDDPSLILNLAQRHWLKEGGRLAIVVPHALSLHRRLAVQMGLAAYPGELGETDRRLQHKWCFTCYDMEELIVQAGFRILEKKGMFTKVLPNSLLTHCSDAQLQGLFDLGIELPIEYSAAIYFLAELSTT